SSATAISSPILSITTRAIRCSIVRSPSRIRGPKRVTDDSSSALRAGATALRFKDVSKNEVAKMKRIVLFLITNLAVVLVLSLVLRLFGLDRVVQANGINVGSLLVFSF